MSRHSSTEKFVICRSKVFVHHTWKDWDRNLLVFRQMFCFMTDALFCEIFMVRGREINSQMYPFFSPHYRGCFFVKVHVCISRMDCKATVKQKLWDTRLIRMEPWNHRLIKSFSLEKSSQTLSSTVYPLLSHIPEHLSYWSYK